MPGTNTQVPDLCGSWHWAVPSRTTRYKFSVLQGGPVGCCCASYFICIAIAGSGTRSQACSAVPDQKEPKNRCEAVDAHLVFKIFRVRCVHLCRMRRLGRGASNSFRWNGFLDLILSLGGLGDLSTVLQVWSHTCRGWNRQPDV